MRDETKDRLALGATLVAIVAGALLRGLRLDTRPLHHDEGVNALFLMDILRLGKYHYNPSNYHGPLLYAMTAPVLWLFGLKTGILRLWPAVLGTATLAVFWPLKRMLGRWGVPSATWLLALSPTTVFFNRDLIHETWFVGSAALMVGALAAYLERPRAGFVVLAWIGFATIVATKETWPILLGALGAGAACALVLTRGRAGVEEALATLWRSRHVQLWGLIVATCVLVVLFTSLFTNLQGFGDMFRAYMFWLKTGKAGAGHEKPWPYFFEILWRYERVAYVLGLCGLVVAFVRREAAVWFGAAAVLFLTAHALIPYKTPWLVIGAIPWLAASAGYLVDRTVAELKAPVVAGMALLLVVASLVPLGNESYRLSFLDYDDDHESIVYSQTTRDFLGLVTALHAVVLHEPHGVDTPLDVMSQDHFPLNWYTSKLTQVGYWGEAVDARAGSIVLVSAPLRDAFRGRMAIDYMERSFSLRPGVELSLLVPLDAFERARVDIPEPGRYEKLGPVTLEPADVGDAAAVSGPLEPGLVARSFVNARFSDEPRRVEPGRALKVDYDDGQNKEWKDTLGIEWVGYLEVPKDGLYRFAVTSDDGAKLEIGGEPVVDDWGRHAQQTRSGGARMRAGRHAIRVRYVDYGGGAKLWLRWTPPDEPEGPLPEERLWHASDDTGPHAKSDAGGFAGDLHEVAPGP